jgi:ribosomal-protein-alanine N-acetyltransferase
MYPQLIKTFQEMILFETERLIVRRFGHGDEALFFQVYGSPDVMHFIRPAKSKEDCNAFFKENLNFYLDHSLLGRFAVFAKKDGQFIGSFAYLYLSGEADFHLGYALVPEAWNQGYATELVRACIPHFFENTIHPTVFAIVSPRNIASQRVLTKAGFGHKGQSEESGGTVEVFYINRNLGTGHGIEGA